MLRALVVVLPPLFATVVGFTAATVLPQPSGGWAVMWWLFVFAASMTGLYGTERAARRLLSLSMLLRLSLIFPDRAPSRFAVALRSGSMRRLRRWAADSNSTGEGMNERLEGVLTLAAALNTHDRRTRGHSERVRALTDLLAAEMGIRGDDATRLRWGALLHDIGKLAVPSAILNKNGAPDDHEWTVLRRHPAEGERIAAGLAPFLGEGASAISGHHERWEGGGYPHGVRGDEIPLAARIVAVTDSFETMTALRSYKRPMTPTQAREELIRCAGKQFDPDVVRQFLTISLPRLNRTVGVLTWLAQVPFLGTMPRAAAQVVTGGSAAAAASPQLVVIGAAVLGAGATPAMAHAYVSTQPNAAPNAVTHVVDVEPNKADGGAGSDADARHSASAPERTPGEPRADEIATVPEIPSGAPAADSAPDARAPAPELEPTEAADETRNRSGHATDALPTGEPGGPGTAGRSGSAGPADNAGPPGGVQPPANAGPPEDIGPPDNVAAPEHAGAPETPGPPEPAGPPDGAGPASDNANPGNANPGNANPGSGGGHRNP